MAQGEKTSIFAKAEPVSLKLPVTQRRHSDGAAVFRLFSINHFVSGNLSYLKLLQKSVARATI
jgi:hypothetical protein